MSEDYPALDRAGSAVLYPAACGLERALADIDGERLIQIRAELITENWDPWLVQSRNIPFLAFAMGVTFWDDAWPEATKRKWMAEQWEFKSKIGTLRALEMAFGIENHAGRNIELMQVITPPQGFYPSGPPSKVEWNEYMTRLPEVRIYQEDWRGEEDGGLFLDADEYGYIDDRHLTTDPSDALAGRIAVIHYPENYPGGPYEVRMKVFTMETYTDATGRAITVERFIVPGHAGPQLFFDDDVNGYVDDNYLDVSDIPPYAVTYQTDSGYDQTTSEYPVTYITPSLEAIVPRYDKGSILGEAGASLMLDADHLDDAGLLPDRAGFLVFDTMRLFDPAVDAPLGTDGDFLDDARLGFPSYTAEVMVRAERVASPWELLLDQDYVDEEYYVPDDMTLRERVFAAALASKALRDTILMTTETTRALEFGDSVRLDGRLLFDERVRRYL